MQKRPKQNALLILGTTLSALSLGYPGTAFACTLCSCSVSTSNVNFGNYNPTASTPTDTSGTVSVNCTGLASLFGSIDVSASWGASGNSSQRTLKQGASSLNYNLYVDSARSLKFGDGNGGTSTMSAPLNGLLVFNQSLPFYARMPARQWVKPGAYSDSIVITVTY